MKSHRQLDNSIHPINKIVRTRSAGVFFGEILTRNGQEAVMLNVRRIWYWAGAASLSQLAVDGTSNPGGCKFPATVSRIEIFEVIEILDVTNSASISIQSVLEWRQ